MSVLIVSTCMQKMSIGRRVRLGAVALQTQEKSFSNGRNAVRHGHNSGSVSVLSNCCFPQFIIPLIFRGLSLRYSKIQIGDWLALKIHTQTDRYKHKYTHKHTHTCVYIHNVFAIFSNFKLFSVTWLSG